jgi:hypothetical protein
MQSVADSKSERYLDHNMAEKTFSCTEALVKTKLSQMTVRDYFWLFTVSMTALHVHEIFVVMVNHNLKYCL